MTPPLPKRQPPQPAAAAGTLFVVATVAKAVEPLAVGHSSRHGATQPGGQEFSIGCAVVLVEVLKLVVCGAALLCQLRCTSAEHRGALVEVDHKQLMRLAIPGLLLALTNWGMFAALARLEPLLYQVVIKAVIVVSTAALSQLLLRKRLRRGQWGLLLLLLGGVGCATPDLGSLPRKMAESTLRGLGLAVGASLCFAAQAVYFELVSSESASAARQSVHWQNVQASACGVVANLLLLALLGGGGGHEGPSDDGHGGMICIGLGSRALVAVCAVAATDISSNIAFKQLGANAYSFVRGSSFVLSALISAVFLGERPPEGATGPWTLRFWLGALMVLSASELFARSERGRKLPIAHFTQAASTD